MNQDNNKGDFMNGWTNWETWEAYNLITAYENTYVKAMNHEDLEAILKEALELSGCQEDHLNLKEVSFKDIREAL
jgi:hypothetical protein